MRRIAFCYDKLTLGYAGRGRTVPLAVSPALNLGRALETVSPIATVSNRLPAAEIVSIDKSVCYSSWISAGDV